MTPRIRRIRRVLLAGGLGGTIFITGCLANLTQGVDLLLSPGAVDTVVRLPYSAVAGLAETLLQFTRIFNR